MNKSNTPLVIILTVLITVIVIAATVMIVVLSTYTPSDAPAGTTPADTTTDAVMTTTKKPAVTTTTATTTTTTKKPDPTTKPAEPDKPTTTTKPAEPDKPTTTTKPNTTTHPNTPTPTPGLSQISGTVKGDSIDSLVIYADYVTEEIDKEAKTMKIRFTFYLHSYGLQINTRSDNKLIVNGESLGKLPTDKVNVPSGSPLTRTVLYEYVVEVEKPDDNTPVELSVEYHWHFKGTYAKVYQDWLTVRVDLSV